MKKQDISVNRVKIVYLGIGSNLGDRTFNIELTKFKLHNYGINILKSSSFYQTKSWPDPSKPFFLNVVIKIQTILSPINLLKICNLIEFELGRKRSKKNDPRICDIDIIDYNQKIIKIDKKVKLTIPHKSAKYRNFVLLPLFEISRSWKHPKSKTNIVNLINLLNINDLRSIKQI